jgi:hypothetical protein
MNLMSQKQPFPPSSSWLVRMAAICAALGVVSLVALVVDDRLIAGAPAWLKPLKFGVSGATFLWSIAWMTQDLRRTRLLRVAETLIGVTIIGEILVIMVQAARGQLSHFNVDTPLDSTLFAAMGGGIATVWVLTMLVLVLHVRTRPTDRALALAFRAGLLLHIVGASVGWIMTQPRPQQLDAMKRGERPFVVGAHTIGGQDGGPGLPLTRWSREHGDLRVPHFVGMHALQLLPLLVRGVRAMRGRRNDGPELAVLGVVGVAAYLLFAGALWQALRDYPLLRIPGGVP